MHFIIQKLLYVCRYIKHMKIALFGSTHGIRILIIHNEQDGRNIHLVFRRPGAVQ